MTKGRPDYLQTVQDPTGKTGAKVDSGGFLAAGVIEGSGFIGSVPVVLNSTASIAGNSSGSTTWTNIDTALLGKYKVLQCSWNENTVPQRVRLENLTTGDVICDQYFICSCEFNLSGFSALGTDSMKVTLYNNAASSRTVHINIQWVEIEPD